ncbi:MAG TPA: hypothetical protein VHL78_11470 [Actinomycetota bacterium]|nr:hypothetical protein [Actinomycetota bacterium]
MGCDVIVVGARCAGSPLAMLLARRGYHGLFLDRGHLPSDTVSSQNGSELRASLRSSRLPLKGIRFRGSAPPEALSVRRRVLGRILVEAAVGAGAELRDRFT